MSACTGCTGQPRECDDFAAGSDWHRCHAGRRTGPRRAPPRFRQISASTCYRNDSRDRSRTMSAFTPTAIRSWRRSRWISSCALGRSRCSATTTPCVRRLERKPIREPGKRYQRRRQEVITSSATNAENQVIVVTEATPRTILPATATIPLTHWNHSVHGAARCSIRRMACRLTRRLSRAARRWWRWRTGDSGARGALFPDGSGRPGRLVRQRASMDRAAAAPATTGRASNYRLMPSGGFKGIGHRT